MRMRCRRWLALLFAVCLLAAPCIVVRAEAVQQDVFIEPTLPKDADPYDPEKPDQLSEDQLYARAAILIEATTGEVIFEKNADEMMYPASTTKILTTLLGIMMGDLEATVTMTDTAAALPDDNISTIPLAVGETIKFQDLLYATMLRSGNDGANLIAEVISGNINDFVGLMNQAAAMYGCTSTHFQNPTGLFNEEHYTTARDMSKLAQAAMQNELFQQIARCYSYPLPRSNLNRSRVLVSGSDALLNPFEGNTFYYEYATGIKTGFLSKAGHCYVGSATRDNVQLISVVLYTTKEGRWTDTKKLMEYGFSQFVSMTPLELYALNPFVIETSGFSMEDEDLGRLQLNLVADTDDRTVHIVATKAEVESMARNLKQLVLVEYTRDFAAPISVGEEFGTLTYYPSDGGSPIEYTMVASRAVTRRANAPLSLEEIEQMVYADPNPFPPMSVDLILVLLVPVVVLALLVWLILWLFQKTGRRRKSRVPKPKNRYFR